MSATTEIDFGGLIEKSKNTRRLAMHWPWSVRRLESRRLDPLLARGWMQAIAQPQDLLLIHGAFQAEYSGFFANDSPVTLLTCGIVVANR